MARPSIIRPLTEQGDGNWDAIAIYKGRKYHISGDQDAGDATLLPMVRIAPEDNSVAAQYAIKSIGNEGYSPKRQLQKALSILRVKIDTSGHASD